MNALLDRVEHAVDAAHLSIHTAEQIVREVNAREAQEIAEARSAIADAIGQCDRILAQLASERQAVSA